MPEITFTKVALPYGWLGNMSPYPVEYQALTYRTTEALFQALRFDNPRIRELIRAATSPMTAKMIAKNMRYEMVVTPQSPEDLDNMRFVLKAKLAAHPSLKGLLGATGDATIIEDVSARRRGSGLFWGMARTTDSWEGQNWLGRLWMELRDG